MSSSSWFLSGVMSFFTLLKTRSHSVDMAALEVANGIAGSSSTSLWALQDPLIIAVGTPLISIHCAIVDSTALSAVLPDLRDL
jgi:hypothetical protein